MTRPATGSGGTTQRLVREIRARLRLRTRLRRWVDRARRLRPRRLPEWSGPAAGEVSTPRPERLDRAWITVESVGWLRRYAAGEGALVTTRGLHLVVERWHPPYPQWSGRLGPLPHLHQHQISLPERGRGRVTVTLALTEPLPLPRIVAAVLPALTGYRPLPAPASAGPAPASADPPGGAGPPPGGSAGPVLVDATTARPVARRYGSDLPAGRLSLADGGTWWRIMRTPGEPVVVVAGRVGESLDERQAAALAELGVVTGPDGTGGPAAAEATALAQLAMTGVVLYAPELADATAGMLAPELTALLRAPLPHPGDPLDWEARSVRQRRAALRHHAAGFAVPCAARYPSLARPPAVTALLVTRRPRHVVRAVAALAAQTYPELEIVVGLHGIRLPPAEAEQVAGRARVVPIPGEWNLGEALGEATRHASGSVVTKVDDDDRYGPEHVWDLVLARHYSGATVVGKGAEFVYLEPRDTTVRRRMVAETFTDVVAGGTILLARGDLEAVGGWVPVDRSVDRALLDRVLGDGGLVYRTHGLGFIYVRHDDGHTWDSGLGYFTRDLAHRWRGLLHHEEFGT